MAEIPVTAILERLTALIEPDKAAELLATVLTHLDLPMREAYTPAEVMAIGTAIADAQRALLASSEIPAARELEATMGPVIDALKADMKQPG
ncbi:MAG: hypothetical protein VKS61_09685 [Candidatus Sericytochromatia bacterium]|nr:hypothetical protein [Candidatus Sericytochromatia bacterium]